MALIGNPCGPTRVTGNLGGDNIGGGRDAVIGDEISVELPIVGITRVAPVVITQFAGACDVLEVFTAALPTDCDDHCEDIDDAIRGASVDKEDAWAIVMLLNASEDLEERFDVALYPTADNVAARYVTWDTTPLEDPNRCEDECEEGDLLEPDVFPFIEGDVRVIDEDSDKIEGELDLSLDGGSVEGRFLARECDEIDGGWVRSVFEL